MSGGPKSVLDLAPSLRTPGFRLVDAGELESLFSGLLGSSTSVIQNAGVGDTIATAKQLNIGLNVVSIASPTPPGSGVKLPPASVEGQTVFVTCNDPDGNLVGIYTLEPDLILFDSENAVTNSGTNKTFIGNQLCMFLCVQGRPTFNSVGYWRIVTFKS